MRKSNLAGAFAGFWLMLALAATASWGGGIDNTHYGNHSLNNLTSGSYNTAFGDGAVEFTTSGFNNSGAGVNALEQNTTASDNTAVGAKASQDNSTGSTPLSASTHSCRTSTATTRRSEPGRSSPIPRASLTPRWVTAR